MSHITPAGWYWLIWAFGGFGFYETWALIYDTKDTLSWQIWGLEHLKFNDPFQFADWSPLHYAIAVVLLLGFAWLFVHLSFGLLR